jgi:membrane-associated phospholipid phosphatase
MAIKLTAAILLLSATLYTIPAHAVPFNSSSPLAAADQKPQDQQNLASRDRVDSDVDNINLKYLKGVLTDSGKIVASPLHWESHDWLKLGLVLGVTSTLFLVDRDVKNFAQSHQSPVASKVATFGNDLGNPLYTLPPVGAFYLYGYLADDHKARRASLLSLESLAISGVVASGIKVVAQRHRPNTGQSPTDWSGPNLSLKNLSFCSGHTASSFSIATIFAEEYKDNAFVPPIAYGLATLTGLSRIYSNAHWSSDAFFGAALGYFVSKGVLSLHKEDKTKRENHLSILPQLGKEMTGLSMQMNF